MTKILVTIERELGDAYFEQVIDSAGYFWNGVDVRLAEVDTEARTYRLRFGPGEVDGTVKAEHVVTYDDIARAVGEMLQPGYDIRADIREAILNSIVDPDPDGDAGYIDAEVGNCIVQQAAFGKVIYG